MAEKWNIMDLPRPEPRAEPPGSWLITLSDLLALLLTFFVMVFSMNAVQYAQWESVVNALSKQLNPRQAKIVDADMTIPEAAKTHEALGLSLDYLAAVLDEQLSGQDGWDRAMVHRLVDRVVVSLPATTVFLDNGAVLRPEAARMVEQIATHLRRLQNRILVTGHSSPAPVESARYPTNWELTLDRARIVAGHLRSSGYIGEISAIGYGSSRFADLAPDLDLHLRYDLSDRVDIVIEEIRAGEGGRP